MFVACYYQNVPSVDVAKIDDDFFKKK